MRDEIPALLAGIALWLQSGDSAIDHMQKRELREAVNAFESRVDSVNMRLS